MRMRKFSLLGTGYVTAARAVDPRRLADLVADLTARLTNEQRLYVHCWGGRGRAGTVGAALLALLYGMSADEALERVQRAFDTRGDDNRRSPETEEQRAYVRRFIEAKVPSL